MNKFKATLKNFVDENEAARRNLQAEGKAEAGGKMVTRRRVFGERKDTNALTKRNPVDTNADEPKTVSFSSMKYGGGQTLMDVDCAEDIDRYLRFIELRNPLKPNFLDAQKGVDGRMRQILVDWIIHVQRRFGFASETFSLTVHLLDHALIHMTGIDKSNLQLLGVSCLFVACKYEEVAMWNIEDFIYVAANAFTKQDIFRMEQQVLRAVDFEINQPHSITFLRRYRFYTSPAPHIHAMAKFISEVALVSYSLTHHPPSTVAAVSLFLAFYIFGTPLMNSTGVFTDVFRMSEEKVVGIARSFVDYVIQFIDPNTRFDALRLKYKEFPLNMLTDKHLKRMHELGDNLV